MITANLPPNLISLEQAEQKQKLKFVWFHDTAPAIDSSDFVEGMFGLEQMSVIYGDSNSGKTFFGLDLALHVALGRNWFGRQIEAGCRAFARGVAKNSAHISFP